MENQEKTKPVLHVTIPRGMGATNIINAKKAFGRINEKFGGRYDIIITQDSVNITSPDADVVRLAITDENSAKEVIRVLDDESWRDKAEPKVPTIKQPTPTTMIDPNTGEEHKFPDEYFDDNKEADTNDTP